MWQAIGLILLSGSFNPDISIGVREVFNTKEKCIEFMHTTDKNLKDKTLAVNANKPEVRLV